MIHLGVPWVGTTKLCQKIFQLSFCPHSHLWLWILGNDRKNAITSASVRNEVFTKIRRNDTVYKVRSSEVRKSLNIEPLLLRIERSQLRWFGHVSRMPQKRLPKQALHAKANGRRPVGRSSTRWIGYPVHWGSWMELLGTSPKQNDGGDERPWSVAA